MSAINLVGLGINLTTEVTRRYIVGLGKKLNFSCRLKLAAWGYFCYPLKNMFLDSTFCVIIMLLHLLLEAPKSIWGEEWAYLVPFPLEGLPPRNPWVCLQSNSIAWKLVCLLHPNGDCGFTGSVHNVVDPRLLALPVLLQQLQR